MASNHENYIKNTPHLAAAWAGIQNPKTEQDRINKEYWEKRGATSIDSFGQAHAKETNALITGDYQREHGAGSTKVKAGTNTSFARRAIPELEKAKVKSAKITVTAEDVKQKSGETTQYGQSDVDTIISESPFSSGRTAGKNVYTKQSGVDYDAYVDKYPDLSRAWNDIVSNPYGVQARYWIPRMGVTDPSQITKEAFGIAHRGENEKLFKGTYKGATKVIKGNKEYDDWLKGKDPDTGQRDPESTYWVDTITDTDTAGDGDQGDDTVDTVDSGVTTVSTPGGWGPGGPGGSTAGEMLATPYTQPGLLDWSQYMPEGTPLQAQQGLIANKGAYYQPWATGQQTPTALLNYTPPTNVGYKPTFVAPNLNVPPVVVPSNNTGVPYVASDIRGGESTRYNAYPGGSGYQQWDDGAEESEYPTTALTMTELEAMQAAAARSANLAAQRMTLDSIPMAVGPPGRNYGGPGSGPPGRNYGGPQG